MGRVFRAYDRDREEEVAAKLVLARSEIDLDTLLRFQQEGAVLARLHHPHIVRIHDTFAEEHASCIIMELLDGHSLGQILQAGPLPLDRATAIALKVVDALSYAHSQEIVHRDIKPDNVMVLEGDQVKVTDFGIARILQPDTSPQTIATTGMRMGTPLYMAPEQIAGKKIDRRADVYALGCMLYHMVTGRPPFEGADALAVAVQQLQDEPQPPSTLNHDVPEEWDAVILKALEKEPARRFQSARELGQAIADLPKGPGEGTRSPSRTRNRVALAITGLLLVLLAMVIVLRMTQSNSSRLSARGATSTPVLASGPITALANGTEIDAYLQHANFRGYMLFEKGGRTILSKGYGMADSEHRAPNVAQTKWPMFGVNEFMVAVAIMKLQEESKLSIHDHICRYIRACPAAWHPITIKELLSDSSGIDVYDPFRGSSGLAQTMAACRAMPLVSRPGAPSARSHCNPLLLSTIVERVTHQPWALAMQRLVFGPAGMTDTGQLTNALQPPEIARGYRFGSPQTDLNYYSYPMAYSTVEDIRRFDHALLAGKLISEQSRQTMFTALWSASSGDPVSQGLGTYIQTGQFTPTSHLALNHVPFQESSGDSDFGEEAGIRVDNAFCPANGSIWIYVTNDPGLFTNVDENHLFDLTAKLLWTK
jgi:serine/threonine protein kinase